MRTEQWLAGVRNTVKPTTAKSYGEACGGT